MKEKEEEEEEEKKLRSGCCISSLFRHPCRSRFALASINIPRDEPAKTVVHNDNDNAKPVTSSSSNNAKPAVPDKSPPAVPASARPPQKPATAKKQTEGQPPPNSSNRTQADRMTRKRSKRRNLVRASSSNVMLLANLGNLRGKRNATVSPSRDVLDFLPKTAKELEMDAKGEGKKDSKDAAPAVRENSEGLNAEQLKEMGNEEYKKGKYAEAVALYDQAIAKDPEKASYWSNKAAALIGLGQLLEAVGECKEAVRIDPSYCRAHYRLAVLYAR